MSETLSDRYNPKEVETKNYDFWLKNNFFKAEDVSTKPPFSIVIPPPNVTGSLHLGHALNHTIQDVLTRWKRMSGFNALWLPGTDHAGIATQMVVEKELLKQNIKRKDLSREKFLEKVWEWKEKYGSRILEQMKYMGAGVDWDRTRFTLDEGLSKAVREVFVKLHKDGMIYRGKRLVNWDTHLETAVSDLEVENEERNGTLWHLKYEIEGSKDFLTIATTRPETLLGDTAVCVHPDDERYKKYIGKKVILPLLGRKIAIIADAYVDQTFGSGVVKITPAHDFNDYEIGMRHKLEFINILNSDGTLNENAGPYKGLKVQNARKKILEDLTAKELLIKEQPHKLTVPICSRSGVIIEPYLSNQWYVEIKKLAGPAKGVVQSGAITFEPESWAKTYLHWMENIEDWCISRQLWWGHRIPAWYCGDCNHITVPEKDPTECEKCKSKNIKQDEDVLDTWFSSALWPFSTLGWPKETEALKTFYPTTVLVTGHDIIFFWVARMVMMGLYFVEDIPFRKIYINGIVRDAQGKKMSKSVGNTIDPMDIIEKHGADSLRYTLLSMIASGKDIKFSDQRLEGYRNFMNKIWNATRFSLSNLADFKETKQSVPPKADLNLADKWLTFRLGQVETEIHDALDNYRFSDATNALYQFVWNDFCDWYLEYTKPIVYGDSTAEKKATQMVLAVTLNRIMRLLHPFAPFISEEIFQKLPIKSKSVCVETYPTAHNDEEWLAIGSKDAHFEFEILKDVITAIRNIRGENSIKPGVKMKVKLSPSDDKVQKILGENKPAIIRLAGLEDCEITKVTDLSKCAVALVQKGDHKVDVVIPLEGLIDFAAEITRLEKLIEKSQKELGSAEGRLRNENFVKNAPPEVIEKDKARIEELKSQVSTLTTQIKRLQ
jgi:valyl-tRNA synthetase